MATYGKPVLYLHGDGHKWRCEKPSRAPNLLRIQVDQVTKARPVHHRFFARQSEAPLYLQPPRRGYRSTPKEVVDMKYRWIALLTAVLSCTAIRAEQAAEEKEPGG